VTVFSVLWENNDVSCRCDAKWWKTCACVAGLNLMPITN